MATDTDMGELELLNYESEGEHVASGEEAAADSPAAAEDAPQAELPEHEALEHGATEPGPRAGVMRTVKSRRKKQGKGKACTRTHLLAKARQGLAARRAAVADIDEQVANLPRSEDLEQDEQVAPDPVMFSDDERLEFDELPPFVPALHARAGLAVRRAATASLETRSTPLSGTGATAGAAAAEVVDRELSWPKWRLS